MHPKLAACAGKAGFGLVSDESTAMATAAGGDEDDQEEVVPLRDIFGATETYGEVGYDK